MERRSKAEPWKMDVERKGKQSEQRMLYCRFLCFGNGKLNALYDRSYGFHRRQIILTAKQRESTRADDPFLSEKLDAEVEGIFLWCLKGLKRLIARNYEFTISDRANRNLKEAVEESNNIVQFMQSSGYIRLEQGTAARSVYLYTAYKRWCKDNLEIPLSQKTFSQYLTQNAGTYGILYSKHVIDNQRGFKNILVLIDPDKPGAMEDTFSGEPENHPPYAPYLPEIMTRPGTWGGRGG